MISQVSSSSGDWQTWSTMCPLTPLGDLVADALVGLEELLAHPGLELDEEYDAAVARHWSAASFSSLSLMTPICSLVFLFM